MLEAPAQAVFLRVGKCCHMGSEKVTVQNLAVVKVDKERGLLLIKGAVPGPIWRSPQIKDSG